MNKRLKALFSAMLVCMLVVLAACGTDTKDTGGYVNWCGRGGKS